jgi:hypothetical protein
MKDSDYTDYLIQYSSITWIIYSIEFISKCYSYLHLLRIFHLLCFALLDFFNIERISNKIYAKVIVKPTRGIFYKL